MQFLIGPNRVECRDTIPEYDGKSLSEWREGVNAKQQLRAEVRVPSTVSIRLRPIPWHAFLVRKILFPISLFFIVDLCYSYFTIFVRSAGAEI